MSLLNKESCDQERFLKPVISKYHNMLSAYTVKELEEWAIELQCTNTMTDIKSKNFSMITIIFIIYNVFYYMLNYYFHGAFLEKIGGIFSDSFSLPSLSSLAFEYFIINILFLVGITVAIHFYLLRRVINFIPNNYWTGIFWCLMVIYGVLFLIGSISAVERSIYNIINFFSSLFLLMLLLREYFDARKLRRVTLLKVIQLELDHRRDRMSSINVRRKYVKGLR